ncbi:MAG: lipid-A-disaccharide synthase [Candidatus Omnitrophota bacterium]
MKKIVIVAGDRSGDIYGGFLCKKLQEKFTDLQISSFGGPSLAQESHQILDLTAHSVSGIAEVFFPFINILIAFRKTIEEVKKINPDLIILIDFPDFNLRLAQSFNNTYRIFYYVSPQVWAWRKKRIELIKKYVEKMIVIFRFEENFYQKESVPTLYFGHPLLELIEKRPTETKKIISFMPGSRKNEIKKHLPVLIAVKKIMEIELKEYEFRIIRPDNIEEKFYKKFKSNMNIVRHSYEAIQESEFVITSSGTATVEIALLGVPFAIIYKLSSLSWEILRRIVDIRFIGMVNILFSKKVVEEFLQRDATPENIAAHALSILKNKEEYEQMKTQLATIKDILAPLGATNSFAEFIGKFLKLPRKDQ